MSVYDVNHFLSEAAGGWDVVFIFFVTEATLMIKSVAPANFFSRTGIKRLLMANSS